MLSKNLFPMKQFFFVVYLNYIRNFEERIFTAHAAVEINVDTFLIV